MNCLLLARSFLYQERRRTGYYKKQLTYTIMYVYAINEALHKLLMPLI